MKLSERLTGPGLVLFGAGVIAASSQLPGVPGVQFGADLMPDVAGAALILFGILIAWPAWSQADGGPLLDVSEWDVSWRKRITALWTVGGLMTGALLFQTLGFPLVGLIYMAGLMALIGARPLTIAIVTPLFVLALYLGFSRVMMVELPAGPLGGLL